MGTQSRDTRPEAEQILIQLLSRTSVERRLELGLSLSEEALAIAHQAIAQAHPLASEVDQKLLFVEITYGKDLAERVRTYLTRRQQ